MKEWLKNAVFYEIYPQSFNDTNADGIGDFNGIIEKLDYIKETGFNAIWMNPCFDSPFADAGYDVRDYYKTAERYGTNEDLKRLFDEVHKRDMHILLDLVPGHTSIECEWFEQSKKAEKNRYSDRYIWSDSVWTDVVGSGNISGSLRGISERDGSCALNFFSSQPALNYGFAEVTESWQLPVDSEAALDTRKEILNIICFWLELGADGFRVDMAGSLVKSDDGQKETVKLWKDIFSVVKEKFPNTAFVSEWGEPDKAVEGGFDMDFLLHCGPSHYLDMFHIEKPYFSESGCGSAEEFLKYYNDIYTRVFGRGYICIPSGNHDMPRISHFCDEKQMKLVFAFMMSMPGVPFVYYGDEIGMKYVTGLTSVEGGYNRTGSRTPMQWDKTENCGFSSADASKLYIRQDNSENRPTVEEQLQNENSLLCELKKQIRLRKENEVLQADAKFELINGGYPLVYKRMTENDCVLVAINPTNCEQTIKIEEGALKEVLYSFGGVAKLCGDKLTIPPVSATYLKI